MIDEEKLIRAARVTVILFLAGMSILLLTMCSTSRNTQIEEKISTDCKISAHDSLSQKSDYIKADEIIFEHFCDNEQKKDYLCDIVNRIKLAAGKGCIHKSNNTGNTICQSDNNNEDIRDKHPDRILIKGLEAVSTQTDKSASIDKTTKKAREILSDENVRIDSAQDWVKFMFLIIVIILIGYVSKVCF